MHLLIAGIGNIFFGDDAFGSEVARKLLQRSWPEHIQVADFGIRSIDLVYAMSDELDLTILIDATQRGERPGTVSVIEPDMDEIAAQASQPTPLDGHTMDPMKVLKMVHQTTGRRRRVLLVGCEPAYLGGEEGYFGMPRYTIDVDQSRFTVQAFAAGMLKSFGHNPTMAVKDFTAQLDFDPDSPSAASFELAAKTNSLTVVDEISEKDRNEITSAMNDQVLEIAKYPDVSYKSTGVSATKLSPKWFRLQIAGELSLHGITHPLSVDTQLKIRDKQVNLSGECELKQSNYGIKIFTAMGGTMKLKDELKFVFDLKSASTD